MFCLQITTAQIGLTTQERQKQERKYRKVLPSDKNSPNRTDYQRTEPGEKKGKFCFQITTAQLGLTAKERQSQKKKRNVLSSDNNSPNRTDYTRETETGEKIQEGSAFR